jgi:hypothetical protein
MRIFKIDQTCSDFESAMEESRIQTAEILFRLNFQSICFVSTIQLNHFLFFFKTKIIIMVEIFALPQSQWIYNQQRRHQNWTTGCIAANTHTHTHTQILIKSKDWNFELGLSIKKAFQVRILGFSIKTRTPYPWNNEKQGEKH